MLHFCAIYIVSFAILGKFMNVQHFGHEMLKQIYGCVWGFAQKNNFHTNSWKMQQKCGN